MQIEEKFNKSKAKLIDVQSPTVRVGPWLPLGVSIEFFPLQDNDDRRTLTAHLTATEALELAEMLLVTARHRLKYEASLAK